MAGKVSPASILKHTSWVRQPPGCKLLGTRIHQTLGVYLYEAIVKEDNTKSWAGVFHNCTCISAHVVNHYNSRFMILWPTNLPKYRICTIISSMLELIVAKLRVLIILRLWNGFYTFTVFLAPRDRVRKDGHPDVQSGMGSTIRCTPSVAWLFSSQRKSRYTGLLSDLDG